MALQGLTNRVVVITGGASGLGLASAARLLSEGARVALLDVDAAAGTRAVSKLGADRALFVESDVRSEAQVAAAFATVVDHYGSVDALYNNAGVSSGPRSLLETGVEELDRMFEVNVRGTFLCLREAMRVAARRGGAVTVVNTASGTGVRGAPSFAAYSATKAAVIALTRAAAIEGAALGVRVNAVLPGPIDTPMTAGAMPAEARQRMIERIPQGRFGTAEEVAALVAWLLSDEAPYVTGGLYAIDGGETA